MNVALTDPMALFALLFLVLACCIAGLLNWRYALFGMVVIATVQDPLRKLVIGTPGWLVLASMPVFFVAAGKMMHSKPNWWLEFRTNFPAVARAAGWFGLACIPAAFISATYGPGSWMLTLLGAISYSILLLSIVVGYQFPLSVGHLRSFIGSYCILSAPMLAGAFVEFHAIFTDNPMIGTQELGMTWIRLSGDYVVSLIAGFYRSPDIMGWHAATTTMMALVLALTAHGQKRWAWLLLAAFAFSALLLCGRRKMVFMIPIFIVICSWLYWTVGRRQVVIGLTGLVLAPLLLAGFVDDWLENRPLQIRYYSDNTADSIDQIKRHGFQSVIATYNQAGFFGSGLGVATPGSQHLNVARPKVWQESGPSRIMVELGVPGVLTLLTLLFVLLQSVWRVNQLHLYHASSCAGYTVGLTAFFLVNGGSLVVSGQILADPFINSFLGLVIGIILSFVRLPEAAQSKVIA